MFVKLCFGIPVSISKIVLDASGAEGTLGNYLIWKLKGSTSPLATILMYLF